MKTFVDPSREYRIVGKDIKPQPGLLHESENEDFRMERRKLVIGVWANGLLGDIPRCYRHVFHEYEQLYSHPVSKLWPLERAAHDQHLRILNRGINQDREVQSPKRSPLRDPVRSINLVVFTRCGVMQTPYAQHQHSNVYKMWCDVNGSYLFVVCSRLRATIRCDELREL